MSAALSLVLGIAFALLTGMLLLSFVANVPIDPVAIKAVALIEAVLLTYIFIEREYKDQLNN